MSLDVSIVKRSLAAVSKAAITRGELAQFIQLSEALVRSFLESRRSSVWRVAERHGLTIAEVAQDCIADAFRVSGKGEFPHLQRFIASLHADLDSLPDHEVLIAYKAFILRIAERQLSRLYAQADPEGRKIYRNIREATKREKNVAIVRDFRGLVLQVAGAEPLDERPQFPPDELEHLMMEHARSHQTIPDLLRTLAEVLCRQSEFRRSVPLFNVMAVFKKVYIAGEELDDAPGIELDGLTDDEIADIRMEVERAVNEKIFITYYAKGKLDNRTAESISRALRDMMVDWCDGNGNDTSLFQYIARHADVDETEYADTLRTKMEYLRRIAREEFSARLIREL